MSTSDPRVVFATSRQLPELSPDCRLAPPAFAARGWDVRVEVWDDPTVDWTATDLVIIRSVWDYYLRREAFIAWLDLLDAANAHVENPTRVVRHNLDKHYLGELEAAGAAIVATFYAPLSMSAAAARTEALERGWSEVVIKPTVNAAGHNTHRVDPRTDDFDRAFATAREGGGLMIQRFVPAVVDQGEWSLVFFAGTYSHAVRKTARPGEFRVQDDWGGAVHIEQPSKDLIDQATHTLECAHTAWNLPAELAYARVDGVVDAHGQFLLMELELIEPELFLRADDRAPERFADAIAGRLPDRA
jgi:glutathione synthase/RimK-type ligase-like ATP-grasp enzyme